LCAAAILLQQRLENALYYLSSSSISHFEPVPRAAGESACIAVLSF
jgi:hypothetical protein